MRPIKTTTGAPITLDGDLLAIMETLYKELSLRHAADRTFEDMLQEIGHLVDQMTEDERRAYFVESLFLNTVTYENEKLGAYMRKLAGRWRLGVGQAGNGIENTHTRRAALMPRRRLLGRQRRGVLDRDRGSRQ